MVAAAALADILAKHKVECEKFHPLYHQLAYCPKEKIVMDNNMSARGNWWLVATSLDGYIERAAEQVMPQCCNRLKEVLM